MHSRLALDHGGRITTTEQPGHPLGVDRGRHREQPQVLTKQRSRMEGEGESQVGLQVPLVQFIEDHQRRVGERRVTLKTPGEHSFGHDLDGNARTRTPVGPGHVADGLTGLLPQQLRHPAGGGPGRKPSRLEHHDLPFAPPWLIDQMDRDHRRLAGSRWSNQDCASGIAKRCPKVGDDVLDRQTGG